MEELYQVEDTGFKFDTEKTGYYLKDQLMSLCEQIDTNNGVLTIEESFEYLKQWNINVVDVMVLIDKDVYNLTHKGLVDIPNATQSFMFMVSDLDDNSKFLEMSNFDVSKNVTKQIADALIDIKSKYGIYEEESLENLRLAANIQIKQMQSEDYENMIEHILQYQESYFLEDTLETSHELFFNKFAATKDGVVADIQKLEDETFKIEFYSSLDEKGTRGTELFDSVKLDEQFNIIMKNDNLLTDTHFSTVVDDLNSISAFSKAEQPEEIKEVWSLSVDEQIEYYTKWLEYENSSYAGDDTKIEMYKKILEELQVKDNVENSNNRLNRQ